VKPNVSLNEELTRKDLQQKLDGLSYTKGIVAQGTRIIGKGEIMDGNKLEVLESLKKEYQSDVLKGSSNYIIIVGYALLVALALFMVFLFMKKYAEDIFENNK